MRRLPRVTWIAIVITGILVMLSSVMGNIGATALTWLSPWVALVLFVFISLSLIGVSLWQERQKAAFELPVVGACENREIMLDRVQNTWITGFLENPLYYSYKGEDVEGLKQVLRQSEALRALATTPLFLTALILAYHGKPVQELLAHVNVASTDQLHLLFHDYLERMLQRKGTRVHAPAQQAKYWLVLLAQQMHRRKETAFYPEALRPEFLPEKQIASYHWSLLLISVLVGALVGVLVGVLAGRLAIGLAAGLAVGLLLRLALELTTAALPHHSY